MHALNCGLCLTFKSMHGKLAWHLQALDSNADDYQYFKAVQFVKKVKKGPLQETSPLLNDISGVPTWEKVGFWTTF